MPADEHEAGLDQRLPWGRLRTQPARRLRRMAAPAPEADEATAEPAPPQPAPPGPAADIAEAAEPVEADAPFQPILGPEPEPAPPAASEAPPEARAASVDVGDIQRSIEVLLMVLEGRMDRFEERMDLQGALVPAFLDEIETHIRDRQSSMAEESRQQVEDLRRDVDERIEALATEVKDQLDRLQTLLVASHTTLIDAVEALSAAVSEVKPGDPALDR